MLSRKISKRKLLLLVGDIFIIGVSLHIASLLRHGRWMSAYEGDNSFCLIFILISFILSFYVFDLYNSQVKFLSSRVLVMFLGAMVTVALLMAIFFYFIPFGIGRGIFFYTYLSLGVLSLIWRAVFSSFFGAVVHGKKVLVVGGGKGLKEFVQLVKNFPEYRLVGFINDSAHEVGNPLSYLGQMSDLENVVAKNKINSIVIASGRGGGKNLSRALVNCRLKGIGVYDILAFFEQLAGKLPVLKLRDSWFIQAQGFDKVGSSFFKKVKRWFDFVAALLIIALSLPFTIVIALLIKLTSRGPVFYFQERLGENEKPYKMYKFRTMGEGAEKNEPKWAEEEDDRVTAVGKVLRKTRLDELPQLINVLKGEMSLIGPRPEREYFIKRLKKKIPYYSLRFAVKPGITGWAQVNYRYGATIEDALEKLTYDLYYIKNMSLFLDLRILLKTVRVCLFGMGGR